MRLSYLYIVFIILLVGGSTFIPRDLAFPVTHSLQDPAKATLDILDGITKLIAALDTALLGAAGAVVVKAPTWTKKWELLDSLLMTSVFVFGAISYFGIYFMDVRILTMVNAATVNPSELGLTWGLRLAYLGTIAGVVVLGLVFSRLMDGRSRGD